MPRKREVTRRPVPPDPIYNKPLITKFINVIMKRGKKSVAERIMYGALDIIQKRTKQDPLPIFEKAVENVKPLVEVKSRRVGGSTYQVPVEIRSERRVSLAIRWLVQFSQKRPEKTMEERLAAEIMEAANHRGASVKKREDTHRMAEANKAFAHYRW
ncbi:MAG: 30S ribosomal protein S7 [Thermodesulfobacteriota bacterium]